MEAEGERVQVPQVQARRRVSLMIPSLSEEEEEEEKEEKEGEEEEEIKKRRRRVSSVFPCTRFPLLRWVSRENRNVARWRPQP